jgi:hypothetical protein
MTDNIIQLSKYRSTARSAARDDRLAEAAPGQSPLALPAIDRALTSSSRTQCYPGGIDDLPT